MRRTVPMFVILCFACSLPGRGAQSADDLAMAGGDMSEKQAAEVEEEVAKNPEDLSARTRLLGYYWSNRFGDPSLGKKANEQVLWFIRNHPEAEILGTPYGTIDGSMEPEAYVEGKGLWQALLRSDTEDVRLLDHAANYFLFHDKALTESALTKARELDPENWEWPKRLGHFYMLGVYPDSKEHDVESAKKAHACYEVAYDLANSTERNFMLGDLAKTGFAAGDLAAAERYARKMLEHTSDDWNAGNNVHHGNLILGRVSLANGDIENAKDFLLKAGKTTGSPQLNSFGPNMALALELLKKGERDVVLEYFDLCRKFWDMGADDLDSWSATVKGGGIPDFGANLVY